MIMLYKNIKAMVLSTDRDNNFFKIVTIVLQGVTLAIFLLIICLDDVLQTSIDLMKENGFTLKKTRSDILQKLLLMQTMQMI